MKFKVNENCIGCGLCTTLCPDEFQMTYAGVAKASEGEVPPELEADALSAQASCPADAIDSI